MEADPGSYSCPTYYCILHQALVVVVVSSAMPHSHPADFRTPVNIRTYPNGNVCRIGSCARISHDGNWQACEPFPSEALVTVPSALEARCTSFANSSNSRVRKQDTMPSNSRTRRVATQRRVPISSRNGWCARSEDALYSSAGEGIREQTNTELNSIMASIPNRRSWSSMMAKPSDVSIVLRKMSTPVVSSK